MQLLQQLPPSLPVIVYVVSTVDKQSF